MAKNLKIGDKVMWRNHSDKNSKNMYEIIGDKNTPYDGRKASPFNQPIEVESGKEFILKNITPDGSFHAFQHALGEDLERLN